MNRRHEAHSIDAHTSRDCRQFLTQSLKRPVWTWLAMSLLVAACQPSDAPKRTSATPAANADCRDRPCPGEEWPKYDHMKEAAMKVNGQWYVGPKEYGLTNNMAFYWPSKTPAYSKRANAEVAKRPGANESGQTVEIFLRSDDRPMPPGGYALVRLAEQNDWIQSRITLRKGLERIEMKPINAPWGYRIDYATYYVATELRGADGLPPVATCNHKNSRNGGGFGIAWNEGTVVSTRMNQYHCTDLPELYIEAVRVLNLLKKV